METTKSKTTRIHDLTKSIMDFKILLHLIQTGYKFDDDQATLMIDQLSRSLDLLDTEIRLKLNE